MKLVILGRDGVINEPQDTPVRTPEDCVPIQASLDAIARLCQSGHRVVVAANGAGLDAGHLDVDELNRVHDKLQICAASSGGHLDAIFYNSDLDVTGPDADALVYQEISNRLQIDLENVPAVSATLELASAARRVGARSILLGDDADATLAGEAALEGIEVHRDLQSFVEHLLQETRS